MNRITLRKLIIGYPSHPLRYELDCNLQEGELISLVGCNGCGKSTLLKTLAGILSPISGDIVLSTENSNISLFQLPVRDRAKYLALVFTERSVMQNTTVEDIVAMGRFPYSPFLGKLSSQDQQIIAQALLSTHSEELTKRYFNELSDGEKTRVLIAKAIAQQTPTILLDEPTAHLDVPNRIQTFELLQSLAHNQGDTILVSTHELNLALQYSDKIILMTTNQAVIDTPDSFIATGAFSKAFGIPINI